VSKDRYTPLTIIYRGNVYEGEGKIHGGISTTYPKKSYTIKFSEDNLFSDSSLGDGQFMNRRKVIIHSNFDDNSFIRNRLAYWIWNRVEDTFKISSDNVVLFTNGEYEGLYTITDLIDDYYIERTTGAPISGNLYKAITTEADFYVHDQAFTGFEKKYGAIEAGNEGSYDDLVELITLANSSSTIFNSTFGEIASVESYYDWWFFTNLIMASDSKGKNSYHYHPENSKWRTIPWDFNCSFGQDYKTARVTSSFTPYVHSENAIFNKLINNPHFSSGKDNRYRDVLANSLSLELILSKVDSLEQQLLIPAQRDFEKWEESYKEFSKWSNRSDFTTVESEIAYIRSFISEQHPRLTSFFSESN